MTLVPELVGAQFHHCNRVLKPGRWSINLPKHCLNIDRRCVLFYMECGILDSQGDADHALYSHYHALSPHYIPHHQGTNIAPAITVLALTIWCPHLFCAHFCSVSCCSALHSPPVLYPPNYWPSDTKMRAHPWYTPAKTSQKIHLNFSSTSLDCKGIFWNSQPCRG